MNNIDIDSLTLGQLKQISALVNGSATSQGSAASGLVGRYALIRTRNEGINAGIVTYADNNGVILKDARRIWYHRPKDRKMSWYEGVAVSGLSNDSKVSEPVSEKMIIEDYSASICSSLAETSIREIATHEQS